MNVLITGATGFLGGRILEAFAKDATFDYILGTGRKFSSDNKVLAPNVEYLLGDLSNQDFVNTLFERPIDVVINCAGLSSPWGSREAFYQANYLTQKYLVEASERVGVKRFVFISTPSIYFDFNDHLDITEETILPQKLVNEYAVTKVMAEKLLKASSLDYMILRPRALVGRGDTVIMPRVIRSFKEGKLMVMGDGKNRVDLTPVSNMVQAVKLAVLAKAALCRDDFNISNGEPVSLWQSIDYVLERIGLARVEKQMSYKKLLLIAGFLEWKARFFKLKKEPVLTKYSVGILAKSFSFDITKAREKLGYKPVQTTQEAIEEFAVWYKNKDNDKG